MPLGFAPWGLLFDMLTDLRAWGLQDWIFPETLAYWRERIADRPDDLVRFEVEMWFHERAKRRARAGASVEGQLVELGGQVVTTAVIKPIRYHGILVDLPPRRVQDLLSHPNVTLARLNDVTYLRPQSVAAIPEPGEAGQAAPTGSVPAPACDFGVA